YLTAANNVVYYSHFAPTIDALAIRREAQSWAQHFAEPITRDTVRADRGLPLRGRRLRVGYVSPDFYEHPVGRFMHAVLANHDRGAFEVIGYSDRATPDAMTRALRSLCDAWRDTAGASDEALAEQIRRDGIDILVD